MRRGFASLRAHRPSLRPTASVLFIGAARSLPIAHRSSRIDHLLGDGAPIVHLTWVGRIGVPHDNTTVHPDSRRYISKHTPRVTSIAGA